MERIKIKKGNFTVAKGKYLDTHARILGFERKKYFWFFKESDRSLRRRMREYVRDFSLREVRTIYREIGEVERRFREDD